MGGGGGKRLVKENQKRKKVCHAVCCFSCSSLALPPEARKSLQAQRSGWARELFIYGPTKRSARYTPTDPRRRGLPLVRMMEGSRGNPERSQPWRTPLDPAGAEQRRAAFPPSRKASPPSSSRKGKRKDLTSTPTLPLPLFLEELKQKVPFRDSLDRKEGGGGKERLVPKLSKLADKTHPSFRASAGCTNSAETCWARRGTATRAGTPLRAPKRSSGPETRCPTFLDEKGGQRRKEIRKLGFFPPLASPPSVGEIGKRSGEDREKQPWKSGESGQEVSPLQAAVYLLEPGRGVAARLPGLSRCGYAGRRVPATRARPREPRPAASRALWQGKPPQKGALNALLDFFLPTAFGWKH